MDTIKVRAFGEVREVEAGREYNGRRYTAPVFAARFRSGAKLWPVRAMIVLDGKWAEPVDAEGVYTLIHFDQTILNRSGARIVAWWNEAKMGAYKSRHNSAEA